MAKWKDQTVNHDQLAMTTHQGNRQILREDPWERINDENYVNLIVCRQITLTNQEIINETDKDKKTSYSEGLYLSMIRLWSSNSKH